MRIRQGFDPLDGQTSEDWRLRPVLPAHKRFHTIHSLFVDLANTRLRQLQDRPHFAKGQIFVIVKGQNLLTPLGQALNSRSQRILNDHAIGWQCGDIIAQVRNHVVAEEDLRLHFIDQRLVIAQPIPINSAISSEAGS